MSRGERSVRGKIWEMGGEIWEKGGALKRRGRERIKESRGRGRGWDGERGKK